MALFAAAHARKQPSPPTRLDAMPADDFYELALSDEERALYQRARTERGLHGEIALLRLRLYGVLARRVEHGAGEDTALNAQIVRIVDLLVKAQRASGMGAEDDLAALEQVMDEGSERLLAAQIWKVAE